MKPGIFKTHRLAFWILVVTAVFFAGFITSSIITFVLLEKSYDSSEFAGYGNKRPGTNGPGVHTFHNLLFVQ